VVDYKTPKEKHHSFEIEPKVDNSKPMGFHSYSDKPLISKP